MGKGSVELATGGFVAFRERCQVSKFDHMNKVRILHAREAGNTVSLIGDQGHYKK